MRPLPALLAVFSLGFPALAPLRAADPVSFNRDIRPLLNSSCFRCHGGVKEAGELNLQFRDKALGKGESGATAIVPGKPDESEFILRLTAEDATERMPKKEPPLKPEQVELLRRWVAEGAKWEDHWAYQRPVGSGQPLDTLVEKHLAGRKLSFSPQAPLLTLARRISLDLIGLPPEVDRLVRFQNEAAADSEAALKAYVDELLASPAYGERWATPWLDLARHADSKGYESDRFRDMWRYRDWVVDALNEDKPYDQFVTEQIAGDLLPNATEEQVIATAYHRNTPQNDEGGTDNEEFRTLAILDRVNATFDALQGTSIGCVQCHGHPYDPFVHREYYELMAFFNNTADADRDDQAPTRKVYARADVAKAETLSKQIAAARTQVEAMRQTREKAFVEWLASIAPASAGHPLEKVQAKASSGTYTVQKGGRVLLQGKAPERSTITVEGRPAAGAFGELVLELTPDKSLPSGGPGASEGAGNFVLTHLTATLGGKPLEFASASASFEQGGWPVAEALRLGARDEGESGWAIAGGTGQVQSARFKLKTPVTVRPDDRLQVVLACENERWPGHVLGSFGLRTAVPGQEPKGKPAAAKTPKDILDLAGRDPKSWKGDERDKVWKHFVNELKDVEAQALHKSLAEAEAALAGLPVAVLPIMAELEGKNARTTQVFHRGNWMDKAAKVEPKTPAILNPWRDEYPKNRLGFARWLTNGENPLTSRVQVNRVWEQLFGVGLVETLEDFGSQGEKPPYQDVLDELAVRFQGPMKWSQKALLREIVLSRTYRQSSKISKQLLELDPANRLLARGPRFRLGNEQIRDQALALGGILSTKMAGPSVMPYQPPGTWLTPYEGKNWVTSEGEDSRRRALYTFIRRSSTYPSMVTFDAPNREFCVVRRTRTNTPLQALDSLNSPVFMEAAAGLAKRMTGATPEEKIARGLSLATLRSPREYEIAALRKLFDQTGGDLNLVANAILNLDEVLTKN